MECLVERRTSGAECVFLTRPLLGEMAGAEVEERRGGRWGEGVE